MTPASPPCASCRPTPRSSSPIAPDAQRETTAKNHAEIRSEFTFGESEPWLNSAPASCFGRPAEHRQVDVDQRAGRRQGGDHVDPPADHPAHHPWHRAPAELPDRPRRHARPAPAAHAAGPAAQRPGQRHLFRGRRIGLCIPADEAIGPATGGSIEQIRTVAPNTTLVAIVTKIDKVSKERVAAQLVAASELVGRTPRSCRCRPPPAKTSTS